MSVADRLVVCASHSPGMMRDVEHVLGRSFRSGLEQVRGMVEEFDPDVIVLFGGDHRRTFRQVVPSFAVALSAGIMAEAGREAGELRVPADRARALADHLLGSGFDITVCRDIELDHAFAQPLHDLTAGLGVYPVIPVAINCATAPLPRPERVLEFGAEVGRFLDGIGDRVLVIGTGGLSHSPPSLEVDTHDMSDAERARIIAAGYAAAEQKIKPEWDKAFLDALSSWDATSLTELATVAHEQAGAGANEVRTWLAAGAAGGGKPFECIAYEPVQKWITGMGVAVSGR
ncbi:3-carboxyethylcatechol 2,3-dioxygenase [Nocardia sp. NBC_00565]|uniref:3-carboxyethylcatechol 2,3-dioxygenase n=1 Tax=Nocardia sp. NBC_00565 TaxID=2975993 RepID=UPI002E811075|nr:3-carboxyethylcatechol 2,3-dioxygenase [Nocardia sp. NBC_00565]WUC05655.1 3-carboxyethylcatechol 2,3-dioxygenase [Nocardia sp. NBC_00565]